MRRLFAALSAALFAAMMTSMAGAAELRIGQGRTVIEYGRAYVEFDIAWRLSWRDETNWDAAWVVVKQARSFEDRHIPLAPDGHSLVANADPSRPGAVITPSEDGMGAFIYRDQARAGRGDNAWTLRLALQLDEDEAPGDLPHQLDVYGVEMVYVPEGPFDVGDPRPIADAPNNAFFQVTEDGEGDAVYRVESAGPIAYCAGPGTLCDAGTVEDGLDPGPIPAAYPNGYSAFYLMKYELTQGQYAAFLNTLSDGQTRSRDITGAGAIPPAARPSRWPVRPMWPARRTGRRDIWAGAMRPPTPTSPACARPASWRSSRPRAVLNRLWPASSPGARRRSPRTM